VLDCLDPPAAKAARSGANTTGWKAGGRTAAAPTFTHKALALLCREGLVQGWVQQNHDGLPQKAGLPQEMINEVHGSWYDPTNPVVKYSGDLKGAEERRMCEDAETADVSAASFTARDCACFFFSSLACARVSLTETRQP
jgi:hypothetical protein